MVSFIWNTCMLQLLKKTSIHLIIRVLLWGTDISCNYTRWWYACVHEPERKMLKQMLCSMRGSIPHQPLGFSQLCIILSGFLFSLICCLGQAIGALKGMKIIWNPKYELADWITINSFLFRKPGSKIKLLNAYVHRLFIVYTVKMMFD